MNLKTITILFISFAAIFSSCKEEIGEPKFIEFKLNADSTGIVHPSEKLEVSAKIVAEGKIKSIEIRNNISENKSIWILDTLYTKFTDKQAVILNETFKIPAGVLLGKYDFTMIVKDQIGNQIEKHSNYELTEPEDVELPELTLYFTPDESYIFPVGQSIIISGLLTDNIALGEIHVALVKNSENISDTDVSRENTICLLYETEFENPARYEFNANLKVGDLQDNDNPPNSILWETSNYYILIKAKQLYDNGTYISDHYPVIVNMQEK